MVPSVSPKMTSFIQDDACCKEHEHIKLNIVPPRVFVCKDTYIFSIKHKARNIIINLPFLDKFNGLGVTGSQT